MQGGKLRYKLEIQKVTSGKDDSGGPTEIYSLFSDVRGDVRTLTGKEKFSHDKVNSELTHRVFCRWVDSVIPEMRIKWHDGRTDRFLNIEYVQEDRTHEKMMIILCKEDRDG